MPPWGMPSMPGIGMTAPGPVPMEHNGFPFDAEVQRGKKMSPSRVSNERQPERCLRLYSPPKRTAKRTLFKKKGQNCPKKEVKIPLIFRGELAVSFREDHFADWIRIPPLFRRLNDNCVELKKPPGRNNRGAGFCSVKSLKVMMLR